MPQSRGDKRGRWPGRQAASTAPLQLFVRISDLMNLIIKNRRQVRSPQPTTETGRSRRNLNPIRRTRDGCGKVENRRTSISSTWALRAGTGPFRDLQTLFDGPVRHDRKEVTFSIFGCYGKSPLWELSPGGPCPGHPSLLGTGSPGAFFREREENRARIRKKPGKKPGKN